jgi:hypothetical protein
MTKITVRIIPNASKSEIVGKELGVWKIRISAPAVDGKANETLIQFLAETYDCTPSYIKILKGHTSKTKIIEIP